MNSEKTICESGGWHEAVISVSDLDATVVMYQGFTGWEVEYQGTASPEQAELWKLDPSVRIDEVVMGNPGQAQGKARLVKIHDVEQRQIRSSGSYWDSGGISNVSSRVMDIKKTFGEMQRLGWVGHHDPVEYEFGPFTVIEVVATGPDGVVFSLVERLRPELKPEEGFGNFSAIFNAPQVVRDFEGARDFYINQLGFQEILNTKVTWKPPGANVLGFPYNIAMNNPLDVAVVQPQGSMSGSIELIGAGECASRNFSELAVPPNLGILMLRFPIKNLESYASELSKRNVTLTTEMSELSIAPYGKVNMIAVRSPDGIWMEFYELLS